MKFPVNSDSVAALGGPPGLEFLDTGGQVGRETGPVPRICQSVLSWEMQYHPEPGAGLSETFIKDSFRTWGNM